MPVHRVSNNSVIGPQKNVPQVGITLKPMSHSSRSSFHRSSNSHNTNNSNNNINQNTSHGNINSNSNNNTNNGNVNGNANFVNNSGYHTNHSIHREMSYSNSIPSKSNHDGSMYNSLNWRHPPHNYHHHHHHHQQRFRNYNGKRKKIHNLQPSLMSPNSSRTSSRDSRSSSQNSNRCSLVGMESLR